MKNIHYTLFTLTSLLFVSANQLYASKKIEKGLTTALGIVATHVSEQVKKSSNASNDKSLPARPITIVSNTQSTDKSRSDGLILNNEKPKNRVLLIKQNDCRFKDSDNFLHKLNCCSSETKGRDNPDRENHPLYNAEPYSDEESDYEESMSISDDEDDQSPSDDEQTPITKGRDTNYNPNNLEPLQPGAQKNFNLKEKAKSRIQNLTPPTIQDSIENNNFTHKKILSKIKPDRTFPSIKQLANTTAGQPTPTPKEIHTSAEESDYEESVSISDDEDDQSPSDDEQTPTTKGRDTNYHPNNLEPLQPGAQENFKENQQNPPHNLNSIPLPIQDDTKDTDSEVSCNEGVGNAEVWNASPPTPSQKRNHMHDENDCTIFEFNKPIKNQDFSPSNDKKNTHSNVINNKDFRKLEDPKKIKKQRKTPSKSKSIRSKKNSGHVNANSPHLPIRHSNNLMIANKSEMNGMSAKEVSDFLRKENKKKRKGQKSQIKSFRNKGNVPREKSAPKVNKAKPRKNLPVSPHSNNLSAYNDKIASANPNKSQGKKHKKPASRQNLKTHVNRQSVQPVNSTAEYSLQKSKSSHATHKNPDQKLKNPVTGLSGYANDENYAQSIHLEEKLKQEEKDRKVVEKLKAELSMPHNTSQPNNNSNSYLPSYNDQYINHGNLQNDRLDDPYTDYNLIDDGIPVIESTIQTKGSKEDFPPSHQDDAGFSLASVTEPSDTSIAKLEQEKENNNYRKFLEQQQKQFNQASIQDASVSDLDIAFHQESMLYSISQPNNNSNPPRSRKKHSHIKKTTSEGSYSAEYIEAQKRALGKYAQQHANRLDTDFAKSKQDKEYPLMQESRQHRISTSKPNNNSNSPRSRKKYSNLSRHFSSSRASIDDEIEKAKKASVDSQIEKYKKAQQNYKGDFNFFG